MYDHDRSTDEYRDAINPNPNKPKNPLAVLDEKALANRLLTHAQDGTGILGHSRPKLLEECALRLSDYSFHLKRARKNSFILGMSAAFFLVGLCFWLASIIRGEM